MFMLFPKSCDVETESKQLKTPQTKATGFLPSSSFLLLIFVTNKPESFDLCRATSVAVPQESKVFSTVPAGAPLVPVWSFGRLPILFKVYF